MRDYYNHNRLRWTELLHYFEDEETVENPNLDTPSTEGNEVDTPTEKSSKNSDFSSVRRSTNTSIQSEVKKEVDRILNNRTNTSQSSQSTPQNNSSHSVSGSTYTPKRSSSKRKKTKPHTTVKTKQTKLSPSPKRTVLIPLNISSNRYKQMIKFNSKEVVSLLNRCPKQFVIYSLCLGDRTTYGNKDLTDLFVKDLISLDYSYVPIYLYDGKKITNIILLIFNVPMRTQQPNRTFSKLIDDIKKKSSYYKTDVFYTYENNHFYLYQNGYKLLTDFKDCFTLIMEYSKNSNIEIKNSQLLINPKPINQNENYNRSKIRNEICIN